MGLVGEVRPPDYCLQETDGQEIFLPQGVCIPGEQSVVRMVTSMMEVTNEWA